MALKWLKSIKKPNSRLFKWSLKLDQYEFDIKHNPRNMNVEADGLSRQPVIKSNENKDNLRVFNVMNKADIIQAYAGDEEPVKLSFKGLSEENGLLYKKTCNYHDISVRIYQSPNGNPCLKRFMVNLDTLVSAR